MNQRSKLRLGVLGAALATSAVFAGTYATLEEPTLKTTADNNMMVTTAGESVVTAPQENVTTTEPYPLATPAIVPPPATEPVPLAAPAPAAVPAPPMTITEQRLTVDERIQAEVMDVLRRNESLTGKVGVESNDRVVRLSGWLTNSGQVTRAGRDARGVVDVRDVVNEIRPRVGAVN